MHTQCTSPRHSIRQTQRHQGSGHGNGQKGLCSLSMLTWSSGPISPRSCSVPTGLREKAAASSSSFASSASNAFSAFSLCATYAPKNLGAPSPSA